MTSFIKNNICSASCRYRHNNYYKYVSFPVLTTNQQRQQCGKKRQYGTNRKDRINIEKVREWTSSQQANGILANRAMEVPSLSSIRPLEKEDFDLEGYLDWRGWNLNPSIVDQDKTDASDEEVEIENLRMMICLVSHALTFPLTLGSHCNVFVSNKNIIKEHEKLQHNAHRTTATHTIRLCCVGARAEATLPPDYWREMLLIANYQHHLDIKHDPEKREMMEIKWIIDFIGPDVPTNMPSRTVSLPSNPYFIPDENMDSTTVVSNNTKASRHWEDQKKSDNDQNHYIFSYPHHSLTMNYYNAYLHRYILDQYKTITKTNNNATNDILNRWDGFILFNPGIGHPNLRKLWKPTLNFLRKTEKPIVLTAHSDLDSERDKLVLKEYNLVSLKEEVDAGEVVEDVILVNAAATAQMEYYENPFGSRMEYIDPFYTVGTDEIYSKKTDHRSKESCHFVRPNHTVLFITNNSN